MYIKLVAIFLQALEIHETIAECMIFANHWVAKKICEAFPDQALVSEVMSGQRDLLWDEWTIVLVIVAEWVKAPAVWCDP